MGRACRCCHPERSEGGMTRVMPLRSAQGDNYDDNDRLSNTSPAARRPLRSAPSIVGVVAPAGGGLAGEEEGSLDRPGQLPVGIDTAHPDVAVRAPGERIGDPVVPVGGLEPAADICWSRPSPAAREAMASSTSAASLPGRRAACGPPAHPVSSGTSGSIAVHQTGNGCSRAWRKSMSRSGPISRQNGSRNRSSSLTTGPVARRPRRLAQPGKLGLEAEGVEQRERHGHDGRLGMEGVAAGRRHPDLAALPADLADDGLEPDPATVVEPPGQRLDQRAGTRAGPQLGGLGPAAPPPPQRASGG